MHPTDHTTLPDTPQTSVSRTFTGCFCTLRWADGLGLLLIVIAGAGMTWWGWLSWPDPVVDFGRELYTPWQITQGKVLYRDMMLFNGPLSQYFNALIFAIFGTSLRTLVITNLVILGLMVTLLYVMIRQIASRLAATFGGLTVVLFFAFNQYSLIGNFNWICPYSHELTHGIALSLLALWLAGRWMTQGSRRMSGLCGLVVGLVFLTKVEVFIACLGAMATAGLLALHIRRQSLGTWGGGVGLFLSGFLLPPLTAWGLLSLAMPASMALQGTLGSCGYVFSQQHSHLPFFIWSFGGKSLHEQSVHLLKMIGWYAVLIGPCVMIGLAWTRAWYWRLAAFVISVGALLTVILIQGEALLSDPLKWCLSSANWSHFALPWPVLAIGLACLLLIYLFTTKAKPEVTGRLACALVYVVFAILMTLKMFMNVRLWQYGFALAMPVGVVMVVLMCDGLPGLLAKYRVNPWLVRVWMLMLWSLTLLFHLHVTGSFFRYKQVYVGHGADAFRCYQKRGVHVVDALDYLQSHAKADESIVVMPEGEIFVYLSRLHNPTRYGQYTPATITLYGQETMLTSLKSHKPTWIVLVHRETSEYGAVWFGKDYAQDIWKWIKTDYVPVFSTGQPPFNPEDQFGIVIARLRQADKSDR